MITFLSIAGAIIPPLVFFGAAVALEQFLYRTDRIFMPVWRPSMLFVLALVSRLTWICWQAMAPMDQLLSYGGPESNNLLVSIVAFSMVVAAIAVWLAWSSVGLLIRDWNAGRMEKPFAVTRFCFLAVGALLSLSFLIRLYVSPLVEGQSLWFVLFGGD